MNKRFSPPISPPRSKRRRLDAEEDVTATGSKHQLDIYSWNVNGMASFIQPAITSFFKPDSKASAEQSAPKASLRDFLRRHNWPTVVCLQEVKINPDDASTIRAVEQAVRRHKDESIHGFDYEAHFCLPSDKHNASSFGKKVYGVCSIIRKDFKEAYVEKIRPVEWDIEGRFLVIETKARDKLPKLAIINIYAVNGTDRPYKDPETGHVSGTRHDRKLEVHRLLQNECKILEAAGFRIILAGDLNIARSHLDGFPNLRTFPTQHCINRADFEAKFFAPFTNEENRLEHATLNDGTVSMIDTFRHLHPAQRSYTYYPRTKAFGESCDRVDMILISQTLKGRLKEAGMYETARDRGPSDHVPLYASFTFDEA